MASKIDLKAFVHDTYQPHDVNSKSSGTGSLPTDRAVTPHKWVRRLRDYRKPDSIAVARALELHVGVKNVARLLFKDFMRNFKQKGGNP